MAGEQNSGEKTERATPKKLRDARKRGEVAKSRDGTSTAGLALVLVLFWATAGWAAERLVALTVEALTLSEGDFATQVRLQGDAAIELFLALSALTLIPIATVGLLVDFLQAGPVFALERLTPKLSHLDPAAGVRRMFGMDNLVELVKSVAKTSIVLAIAWLVVRAVMDELVWLPENGVEHVIVTTSALLVRLAGWTLAVFTVLTLFDAAYQRFSFARRMRMSVRDIRQEHKDQEGDPMLRGQRKQMHQEFAREAAGNAAREASVVIVNPTHVAVAIRYDAEEAPVPMITAKGRDEDARAIREAANESHVPVLRNELLARRLLQEVDEGEAVPEGLFDVIAAVIVWARETRESMRSPAERAFDADPDAVPRAPPGEDLTCYPERSLSWLPGSAAPRAAPPDTTGRRP